MVELIGHYIKRKANLLVALLALTLVHLPTTQATQSTSVKSPATDSGSIIAGIDLKPIKPIKPMPQANVSQLPTVQPIAVPQAPPAPTAPASAPASAVVAGCGDNSYSQYIYQHESGCNLNAVNAGGCRGIGQACPGSKLPCGADYACQNAFFTNYAISAYGGWATAYAFWLAHSWW